jgi:hypothetical protein
MAAESAGVLQCPRRILFEADLPPADNGTLDKRQLIKK